jgi:hypothetical protein
MTLKEKNIMFQQAKHERERDAIDPSDTGGGGNSPTSNSNDDVHAYAQPNAIDPPGDTGGGGQAIDPPGDTGGGGQ